MCIKEKLNKTNTQPQNIQKFTHKHANERMFEVILLDSPPLNNKWKTENN